jgi:hypothetical protein
MSLAELIPLVNDLSQSEKVALFNLLAAQIPDADLRVVFSALETTPEVDTPISNQVEAFMALSGIVKQSPRHSDEHAEDYVD